jgi:hypothetical protein
MLVLMIYSSSFELEKIGDKITTEKRYYLLNQALDGYFSHRYRSLHPLLRGKWRNFATQPIDDRCRIRN